MTVFEELQRRGLIAQMTNPERIEEKLTKEKTTFYIGFDATADSLHVGHFLTLSCMRRLQLAGHQPIALLGTGTTMVGDPTGRTDMRKMLTPEEINYNAECFRKQMSKFIDFEDDKALILRNGDWLLELNYIEMLRDVGVHFSVNRMLATEGVKTRLERGLNFIEFNYAIMQAYDFLHMFRHNNCTMQLGGSDQWSNILSGVDLIRRCESAEVEGLTFNLLTTSEGTKMGKTAKGAVWLDPNKTPPYEFFQYWRNVDDADVIRCLKMLTFVPIEEIEAMESWEGSKLNEAKEILAYELTKLIHSEEDAKQALSAAKALFVQGADSEDIPTEEISEDDFTDGVIGLLDLLVKANLAPSKGEARRLVQQGGITVDDVKAEDPAANVEKVAFDKGYVILRKGKKVYKKVVIS